MKDTLISLAALAVIVAAGAVSYYYLYFLPHQGVKAQQDISAIRTAVAPTQDEQRAAIDQMNRAFSDFTQCEARMTPKRDAYLTKQCPSTGDPIKDLQNWTCRTKAMEGQGYKQFDCGMPI